MRWANESFTDESYDNVVIVNIAIYYVMWSCDMSDFKTTFTEKELELAAQAEVKVNQIVIDSVIHSF